jgi:aminoglycoside 6'-N-acetyltransferase
MNEREPLQGQIVRLRAVSAGDAARLTEIVTHPEVAQWWGSFDLDRVHRELVAPDDGTVTFAIEADGQAVGLIQYLEENEPDYRHAALDMFLHPDWHGRGLGTDALRTLARHLFEDRGHHRLTIDPAAHNQRAIRAYRRVGFRPVGIMRRYERGPEGRWRDGLLMDLLPEDLTEPSGRADRVIVRIWHGWTTPDNADAYQQLLDETIVPNILARGIPGLREVDILRQRGIDDGEVEFLTIMTFDDWAAVESFAGPDTTAAVVPASAQRLLARHDQHSQHYELIARH